MALLINKLFASRKKQHHKQDVSERMFNFDKDQVRLILFRECDFRGRKLLFDSQSVQKLTVSPNTTQKNQTVDGSGIKTDKNEIFVEVSNGYGYQYTRPSNDIIQLGELIFGSVAMSFRGTSLKIHSFSSPAKLMCTQVFPSPRHQGRGRTSVTSNNFDTLHSNNSAHSFEISLKLDYSRASSTASFNEQVSVYSTESDHKIANLSGSVPLDVPTYNNNNNNQNMTNTKLTAPSLEGDSGFCGEQSYSSVSSGPPSMSLWDTRQDRKVIQKTSNRKLKIHYAFQCNAAIISYSPDDGSIAVKTRHSVHGFSCGSLYKRWLRSTSTSLDQNGCSDSSLSGVHSTSSTDECIPRGHHRTSKLGLAVIILLTEGQELHLERFLLEHSALIEAMVSRARSGAENAYTKPSNFVSLMYEVSKEAEQWLTDLIMGPMLNVYLWHTLGPCSKSVPNPLSPEQVSVMMVKTRSDSNLVKMGQWCDRTKNISLFDMDCVGVEKPFLNSRVNVFNKLDNSDNNNSKCLNSMGKNTNLEGEKFVRELCELLECVDVKHTNFFISTLLTAILTHHLGWVSTVVPPTQTDRDTVSKLQSPCNPLWGQLSDLYGGVGSPTKLAHTIICGNNKGEIITKILNTLTYFIRCTALERYFLYRYTPTPETEVNVNNSEVVKSKIETAKQLSEELEMRTLKFEPKRNGLTKTKSFTINSDSVLERVTSLDLSAEKSSFQTKVFRNEVSSTNLSRLIETDTVEEEEEMEEVTPSDKSVIFVLGDNEKLIGLKKSDPDFDSLNIPSCSQRPSDLKLRKFRFDSSSSDTSPQTDTSPCTSSSLSHKMITTRSSIINLESEYKEPELRCRDKYNRSQSVPPPDNKCSQSDCKKKYSGVKFDFKQYPQIVTNYMKGKNLEMSQLAFAEKSFKLSRSFSASVYDSSKFEEFSSCDCEASNEETLQTPSNASELEFTSELGATAFVPVEESNKSGIGFEHPLQENFGVENNAIFQHDIDTYETKPVEEQRNRIIFTELPMPRIITHPLNNDSSYVDYTKTLLRGVNDKYVSDMVLQGTTLPPKHWEHILRRDLTLAARKPILDQPVQEAVAIVANTDTWEVQLISSHTYVVEKGSVGIRVGMSHLVANMLESLLHMWKLRTPPEYCLMHIESYLREFCLRSEGLAQMLMTTDFCNMDLLTSTLQLEVNDVPLLMAIASTHTPQVTQKYGLSFQ